MDILAIGEALIDFTPEGRPGVYIRNFGGAPANLAVISSRMGATAGFIGKVGADPFGDFILDQLRKECVDIAGLSFTKRASTTLAFVHLSAAGERSFQFVRNPGADMLLEWEDICPEQIAAAKIVHFGSAQLMLPAAEAAIEQAVSLTKEHGGFISFDPNYRPGQWENEQEARKHILPFIKVADLIKLSEEEVLILTGEKDLGKAAAGLPRAPASLLVVSCGENGARYYFGNAVGVVRGFERKPVDTTGAGDTFWGTVLARLCSSLSRHSALSDLLQPEHIKQALLYGNAAGAICVASKGAISQDLNLAAVEQFLYAHSAVTKADLSPLLI